MRSLVFGILITVSALAQQRVDLNVVNRIKAEAFDNSKVMDTLQYLTDVYGPRLTASPEFDQAADWAVKRLETYGLENVHKGKWGPFGRSWSVKQYSVEMLTPRYAELDAEPLAWTGGTNGPVAGEAVLAPFGTGERTYGKKLMAELDRFEKEYRGKLKGKIVLLTAEKDPAPEASPNFVRYSDAQLAALANAPEPRAKAPYDLANLVIPENAEERSRLFYSLPVSVLEAILKQRVDLLSKRDQFLRTEGVLAVLTRDNRAHGGLLFAEAASSHKADVPLAPPMFVVTAEQYNRIARLIGMKIPVQVRVNEKVEASDRDVDTANIVGEIPGGDKKDEVVMIGAHFDSWHSATGATDNGAGSAVMMEVMRILRALDLKMDRTVRIALWGGEEEGLYGSKAYVKEHFGDPVTMKVTGEHAKLSGYFNLDNGSGKIRGVYLQGNDAMRPIFAEWLAPFRDLGVTTITIRNTGGTDHLSFDAVGLPGFQFIQDPLDYGSMTHHSNVDTFGHAQAGDLMQAAAVIASVVYDAATRPEMLPRKPLPKPDPPIDAAKLNVN